MEDRIDIPQSFWERLFVDKRRLAVVIGCAVFVLALAAGLVFAQMRSRPADMTDTSPNSGASVTPTTVPSSQNATPSADATGSAAATTTPDSSPASGPTASSTPGGGAPSSAEEPTFVRAPYIAYRLNGAIYVAREDGSNPRKAAESRDSGFALSPDGSTLAYVDVSKGRLMLVDVASGKSLDVDVALDCQPAWAPDSARVLFVGGTRTAPQVRIVRRDGSGAARIGAGYSPRFAGDGRAALWIDAAYVGQPGEVLVYGVAESGELALRGPGGIMTVEAAFGVEGVVAVKTDSARGISRLVTEVVWGDGAGTSWTELPVTSSADKPTTIAHLCASPDGKYLAYAESGDDGFSRAYVYDVARKTSVALSTRRDTYPTCWSSDGSRLLFVEGNAFQGEATSLMSARPDGMGRAVLVEGAGL